MNSTEAGLAGDTVGRLPGDDSWNYVRFYAYHRKFIHMDPLGGGLFETVYLPGHPALSTSNSELPVPGSWRSKDVFTPHPSVPDAWKYITRLDDRVTLVNGEKVLPLPMEGGIRQDPLVREAVVVGIDRPVPGLLLFRNTDDMPESDYLDAVWPTIAAVNADTEAFGQISRDMVAVLGSDVEYPRTDKGSIIRGQVYSTFAQVIDDLYISAESGVSKSRQENPVRLNSLSLDELEDLVAAVFQEAVGRPQPSADVDFFAAGVDSLQALQMRRALLRRLQFEGKRLSSNIVYECGNAKALARFLHKLSEGRPKQNGQGSKPSNTNRQLEDLIAKYAGFGKTVVREQRHTHIHTHTHSLSHSHSQLSLSHSHSQLSLTHNSLSSFYSVSSSSR